MKKLSLLATVLVPAFASLSGGSALAQQTDQGNWLVRARAVKIDPVNHFEARQVLADDSVKVQEKWIPEIDVSYFFTRNIAAELVLTVPQKRYVTVNGADIGSFKHLPPSLLLQYHFNPEGTFRPYVGAGINYTILGKENMSALGGNVTLDNHSVGAAVQLGFDYKIGKDLFFNLDVKKVQIRTDVYHSVAGNLGTLKLDPILWGVGIGYRF
ncbi:MAG: OmpW family protein [Rhodocyclaceae bacterium]|nr:OmpW family protein [Rhodocyclaceae bacterium]